MGRILLTGCSIAEIQKLAYGIDLIEYEVRASVGLELPKPTISDCDGVWCEMVLHAHQGQCGTFVSYSINQDINSKFVKMIDFQKK